MPTHRKVTASRRPNGTTTVGELASLACSSGLVANDDEGRKAFLAWHANDPKAAQKALFSRVAANGVAASGAKAANRVAGAKTTNNYPASWLRGVGGRRGRITEACD